MMDVEPANAPGRASAGEDAEDLLVFVERLAAAGHGEASTARAQEQINAVIRGGSAPPGLRRLAEALAASVAEVPPAPRQPVDDDASSVVLAMRSNALVVLDAAAAPAVAAAVTALIGDGRRVVVTAETDAQLDAVRRDVATGRVVDALPSLPPAELRELRRLLATSTAAGRARAGQHLPPVDALPSVREVDELCAQAARARAGDRTSMVPAMLADVEPDRRAAVTSVAHCVMAKLDALSGRAQRTWEWDLLGHLIHTRHRAAFDRTVEDVAQAVGIVRRRRDAPPVTLLESLPSDAVDLLCNYLEFLEAGGRNRTYFPPSAQREVRPVLRMIRVADHEPESAAEVLRVIDHLELSHRLQRINAGCAEMGVPAPRGPEELSGLADALRLVAAAARSVGALRHDVLFLATDSPLSVPDVDTAASVATAILDYAEHGSATEATHRLDTLAADLAAQAAVHATAAEHELAVVALRQRDARRFAGAVEALEAARREQRDELRRAQLLDRLRAQAPRLADTWETQHGQGFGLACFVRTDTLLSAMPAPDSVDVVVVLGAAQLGVERLLLTAVAPRLIAAVAPDEQPEGSPTLLSVLQRATALVIRGSGGRRSGRVVQLRPGTRSVGVSAVGQAGA
ncbi:MAG: hypothetical protein L0H64_16215 [Pseudonocardia sp.]|nr:hypothetical protein [Pseudonocardia sp.]